MKYKKLMYALLLALLASSGELLAKVRKGRRGHGIRRKGGRSVRKRSYRPRGSCIHKRRFSGAYPYYYGYYPYSYGYYPYYWDSYYGGPGFGFGSPGFGFSFGF